MILALRTDKPETEIYLIDTDSLDVLDSIKWTAHRQLSDTLLGKIDDILVENRIEKQDLSAVLIYRGPGSFTGLRIGVTVANTFAYTLDIPVVGAVGDKWMKSAASIKETSYSNPVIPEYGSEAHITKPRK